MKIVFSRKGFDSTAGGFPSLIFPDGTLFSIPIPSSSGKYLYQDLGFQYEDESIQSILNDVTGRYIHSGEKKQCDYSDNKQYCHYDPMPFDKDDFNGIALGQVDKAEGHLRNQDIGEGDIFLFYGWFKRVEKFKGAWRYAKQEPNIHLIWSYMEIGDCMGLDTMEQHAVALKKYPFLTKHPHVGKPGNMKDRIYLSNMHSYFSYQQNLCLTDIKNYKGRSTWRLPSFMNQPQAFSHLNDFKTDDEEVIISYRGYGQEFVLNLDKVKSKNERVLIEKYIDDLIQ